MASPFRVFRKYQKTLLVVAGVILMFVFVIGDALMGYLGSSRRGGGDAARDANAIAVRWDGDSLTNAELYNLVMQRRILNAFIHGVEFAGQQAAFEAGVEPRRLRVEPIRGPETPQQGVEQHVVQTRLFAQAARDAGMRVGDETIIQYLHELGRGNVSPDQMRDMVNRLQSNQRSVSIDYVIDALREEMLARNYIASHQFAFDTVTPQQRWEDWLKVNDRVVVEAAAIPIERFLVDVPEPSDAELAAFFEKHNKYEPQPDPFVLRHYNVELPMPVKGFRIPRKIDVQFIQAAYEPYVAQIEDKITDEEIEKYYEENKDPMFIKADTGLIDEPSGSEDTAGGEEAEAEVPADEAPGETPSGATSDEPSQEEAETGTDTAAEPVDTSPPETEEPTPPTTPDGPAPSAESGSETAPGEDDQSSRGEASRQGSFRLAAFLQEADAEAAPKDDDAPTDTPPEATEDAAAAAAAAPPSETAPAAGTEAPAADSEPADSAAETPTVTTPPDQSAVKVEPKEFQPLEEVRDLIRRELAERRAAEQLNELVNELASQLNAEFNTYFGQVLDAQAEERDPPPPSPALADLAPLAKEHGLEHGRTGPISWLELRDTPVGKSGSGETGIPLWQNLFASRDLELYQPIVTVDIDGNRYVAMKTSDTPGRVPELAEVKDEVLQAWKRQQAAELTRKYAEEQAKKAEEAGSTLADFFAGEQSVAVVSTDPFSQYTGGDVAFVGGEFQQQPFRLSEPDGVAVAGPDFLQRVFELEKDEVAAVLNHDHSIAYVIRIVEHQNSPEELRTAYLAEANSWPGLRLMISSHARVAAASLVNDIVADAGVEWQRPSDQIERDEEEAG